jgi:hypothetical protein
MAIINLENSIVERERIRFDSDHELMSYEQADALVKKARAQMIEAIAAKAVETAQRVQAANWRIEP